MRQTTTAKASEKKAPVKRQPRSGKGQAKTLEEVSHEGAPRIEPMPSLPSDVQVPGAEGAISATEILHVNNDVAASGTITKESAKSEEVLDPVVKGEREGSGEPSTIAAITRSLTASEQEEAGSESLIPHPDTPEMVTRCDGDVAVGKTTHGKSPQREPKRKSSRDLGLRYAQAAAEVSKIRLDFLQALDSKARLLGAQRRGEAVPVADPEAVRLNGLIRETRRQLDDLLRQKREHGSATPELGEVCVLINRLRRERNAARIEKKAAYEEAMLFLDNQPVEPSTGVDTRSR